MKKVLFFLISLLVGIGLLAWTTNFIGWEKIILAFKVFSFRAGMIVLSLTVLANLVRSWRWQTILRNQGYRVPIFRVLEYYLSGHAVVQVHRFGGYRQDFRIHYLYRCDNFRTGLFCRQCEFAFL